MANIIMKGVGYEDRQHYEPETPEQATTITHRPSTSLHPSLKLKGVPEPRPDLLVIRMSDDDQVSKTDFLELLPGTSNQENWRRTVGKIIRIGELVNTKSVFASFVRGTDDGALGLKQGDKVIIATASGDVYMVKDPMTNADVQLRIISPNHVIAILERAEDHE
jgi:hypothetical protein